MDYFDKTTGSETQDTRIDTRILRHLLREAMDLLEEAQTHILVEKQNDATAYVIAHSNWCMTATCIWAINELLPVSDEDFRAAQLHTPAPIFSRGSDPISPQLAGFFQRVERLHERARRLDDLSRGPVVSSAPQVEHEPHCNEEPRESATIIPLFGSDCTPGYHANPIEAARSKVQRAMGAAD